MGLKTGVRFPAGVRDFSLLHSVQTDSGAHTDPYSMDIRDISLRVKMLGLEANHSSPSSVEVRNGGAITPHTYLSLWLVRLTFH
jgi:hypothetical protein